MTEPARPDGGRKASGEPFVSAASELPDDGEGLAPDEAFGALASEVRIRILVGLRAAEREGEAPLSFSALQRAAGADSSAGFAYHLRQLDGHFVRQEGDGGYRLTPAGRRAAAVVVSGSLTDASERTRAS